MKQKIIGVYYFGNEQIELVLREGTGGEFYATPEKGHIPRIKVGADKEWQQVVSALVHEAFEFAALRNRGRYDPCGDFSNDHSSYLFVMTHPIFSDCCARVAELLTSAVPVLAHEWNAWKKDSKKKGKK